VSTFVSRPSYQQLLQFGRGYPIGNPTGISAVAFYMLDTLTKTVNILLYLTHHTSSYYQLTLFCQDYITASHTHIQHTKIHIFTVQTTHVLFKKINFKNY